MDDAQQMIHSLKQDLQQGYVPQLPLTEEQEDVLDNLINKSYSTSYTQQLGDYEIVEANKMILVSGAVNEFIDKVKLAQKENKRVDTMTFPYVCRQLKGTSGNLILQPEDNFIRDQQTMNIIKGFLTKNSPQHLN